MTHSGHKLSRALDFEQLRLDMLLEMRGEPVLVGRLLDEDEIEIREVIRPAPPPRRA